MKYKFRDSIYYIIAWYLTNIVMFGLHINALYAFDLVKVKVYISFYWYFILNNPFVSNIKTSICF